MTNADLSDLFLKKNTVRESDFILTELVQCSTDSNHTVWKSLFFPPITILFAIKIPSTRIFNLIHQEIGDWKMYTSRNA